MVCLQSPYPHYSTQSRHFNSRAHLLFPHIIPRHLIHPIAELTSYLQSAPRSSSPVNSPGALGGATGRPSSPTPPGGPKTAIRRRAAADQKDKVANARPSSTRSAGAGGSSSTMLSMCFLFLRGFLRGVLVSFGNEGLGGR